MSKSEYIARIIACLLAVFIFAVLAVHWVKKDLHKAVFGVIDWPPRELVAAIRYFND